MFFSHQLGCQKPDHAYFERIERSLEVDGQSILFWDDSAANVESAREFGWNAEVYGEFDGFQEKLAAYLDDDGVPWQDQGLTSLNKP